MHFKAVKENSSLQFLFMPHSTKIIIFHSCHKDNILDKLYQFRIKVNWKVRNKKTGISKHIGYLLI